MRLPFVIGLMLISWRTYSQATLDTDSISWDFASEIVEVRSTSSSNNFSVSTIDSKILTDNIEPTIQPVLNQVPGVWMESGALNTNRISIRGVGNREPFATSRLKVYLDEIPITDGVGETSLEDIDPAFLGKMTIWKNPASAIWGAGLGGLIHLQTPSTWDDYYEGKIQVGSFGRLRTTQTLASSWGDGAAPFLLHYNGTKQDGYRDNNQYRKHNLAYLQRWQISKKTTMQLLGLWIDLKAQIPSSLGQTDYLNTPTKAAFTWNAVEGFEDYTKGLIGLSFRHLLSDKWVWQHSYTLNLYAADELRPFNRLQENKSNFATRHRITYRWSDQLNLQFGAEAFSEKYAWQTSLEQDQTTEILTDRVEDRFYLNLFLHSQYELTNRWSAFAGVSLNASYYTIEPKNSDPDYAFDYAPAVNPSIGVTYQVIPDRWNASVTWSKGFNPIAIENALNSQGDLNNNLKPEVGYSFDLVNRWLYERATFSITLYRMNIRNLIVRNRLGDDQYEAINAGQTLHQGIEFEGSCSLSQVLSYRASVTYMDHRFVDFKNNGLTFDGNALTGSPDWRLFHELQYRGKSFSVLLNHTYLSSLPIVDDNSVWSDSYHLVGAQISHRLPLGKEWHVHTTMQINNVFDEKYASMFQINARGFGGSEPRYYYPGLPRHLQLQFSFKKDL